ncbi:MAG: polyphosphate kinase 2 family protein [Anaerolineae bacterium]|nr:polyphosphate kinase 2 family protein [Anaerolineae bacterium]
MSKSIFHPPIGEKVSLADYDPEYAEGEKKHAPKELAKLQERLFDLQERLYAENKQSLLIILQAMDAAGKDSTIRKVFEGVNPQGVQVSSFKAPTEIELAHDFLWRIHQRVPAKGMIGVFNRSHYEDVLVVRVNNLVPEDVWRKRYAHINHFERLLADSGTHILKFYLNISKAEQKKQLQERLDDPTKHWKFSVGDLPVRNQWDDYMQAFEDVFTQCNTDYAPWHIIPGNTRWYRTLTITKIIVETLEKMNPQYPKPEEGLDKVVIPD